ncbi:hypothetical protein LTR10_020759 [Elasticomyces elasticus]|uniref:Uncharacterized protein n=1 Tax=Exophiala sideris TaxID=1016849 RepID=A0ABR0J752_9EURO|nr:hypothetical protein LTR10_020759 [Elasticomyces elasticus]KAK5028856.1 hypothetical protein LTS07_006236 [Exophiala sideris]KAK5035725.1 hypothetical protein LTR13_005855 [Exophiala sideris]KAK5057360.1 hypothetical protein LTR69_007400 [Exophiala sideris]KAK5181666.1 hypothetical protein LTR44_005865 [Eurotiomycetes sp. CCFEE 6388]
MPYTPLYVALALLMLDGLIEVGMVGSMVGFLHARAGKFFTVNAPTGAFNLHGKPAGIMVNQGHTSNGAAGTAVVLVGIIGLLVIWYEKRRARQTQTTGHSKVFIFWVVMTFVSAGLTLSALVYTFVVTAQTNNQLIDLSVAEANPDPKMYPLDQWTPENWFIAVLKLPLANDSDRNTIRYHLDLMRGWRWNLIPLFILGLAAAMTALWELINGRRWIQGESREKLRNKGSKERIAEPYP